MKNSILILCLLFLPLFGFSQDHSSTELSFDVYSNYPPLSMTKETLQEAQTLSDLHPHYKPSWIKEFISVEVLTNYKGTVSRAIGKNDTLNQEQKDIMNKADAGSHISIKVKYMPENNLVHNEMKVFDFKFIINPEIAATYTGGSQQLNQYIKENAIDKIPGGIFEGYDLAVVKFTINEEGEVTEPHVFWTSNDEKIDALLLDTISKMPCWKPAAYANGLKVKQELVLTVGNMENCIVQTLNIRRD